MLMIPVRFFIEDMFFAKPGILSKMEKWKCVLIFVKIGKRAYFVGLKMDEIIDNRCRFQ